MGDVGPGSRDAGGLEPPPPTHTDASAGGPGGPPTRRGIGATSRPRPADDSPPDDPAGALNRLREQLLYEVAHELRGQVTVLDTALEILSTGSAELSAREFATLLSQARRTSGRLRALTEALLTAGTLASGRVAVAPRPTPLAAIVEDARELVAHATEARRQRVEACLGRDPVWVRADRRYLPQVLSNLLANASKYGPERSLIRITTQRSAGLVTVEVADQGPGIAPEHRPYVFERFYRVRTGGTEPGAGLGLAIAKDIVEAHGGRIGIDSAVGSGTRAWFTLPTA
jgi:signal transduction histidine kinase